MLFYKHPKKQGVNIMMRLGFNLLRTKNFFQSSLLCARETHTSSQDPKRATVVSEVAQKSIGNYSNIFTQSGDKILIHAHLPAGKPPEKRMTFVKLYIYANHLIGNTDISLLELTRLCNREGYRSASPKGNKTSKVESGNFKTSFTSKNNKNLFQLTIDEDNKTQVSLTVKGIQQIQNLADTLNSIDPEEPQGRLKEVITILKKEGFLKEGNPISIKKLGKACEKNGYTVELGNLRSLISAQSAKQFFIFDKDRDTVKLSPFGINAAQDEDVPKVIETKI